MTLSITLLNALEEQKKLVKSWHFLGKSDFGKFPCLQNDFLHLINKMALFRKLSVFQLHRNFGKFQIILLLKFISGQQSSQIHINLRKSSVGSQVE